MKPYRHIIAVANQKGGVGKTTTAINLATALAAADRDVLLIDLDPQGNASTGLGVDGGLRHAGTYELLLGNRGAGTSGGPADRLLMDTYVPRLALLPATLDLAAAELELADLPQRETRLTTALAGIRRDFDYVVIDCPPAFGLLALNALMAADRLLIPVQCEYFALEGLAHMMKTLRRLQETFARPIETDILLTMHQSWSDNSQAIAADVREHFGDRVLDVEIPRNERISEATNHGLPVLFFRPMSHGSEAYMRLAAILLARATETRLQPVAPQGEIAEPRMLSQIEFEAEIQGRIKEWISTGVVPQPEAEPLVLLPTSEADTPEAGSVVAAYIAEQARAEALQEAPPNPWRVRLAYLLMGTALIGFAALIAYIILDRLGG